MLISEPKKHFGGIAQLVERLVRNEKARGSNPLTSNSKGFARVLYRRSGQANNFIFNVTAASCSFAGIAKVGALLSDT